MAWVLDYPGCFAFGHTEREVLARIPQAVREYFAWLDAHGIPAAGPGVPEDFQVVEIFEVYTIGEQFRRGGSREVHAGFLDGWRPLTEAEVAFGLQVLAASRTDREAVVEDLRAARRALEEALQDWAGRPLVVGVEGEFWSPRKALRRTAWHERDPVAHLRLLRSALGR